MGFRYAKGLREETALAIVRARSERPFESIADLAHRVPELRRNELVLLASIGALNPIGCTNAEDVTAHLERPNKKQHLHRRDALWHVERAARFAGPLLEGIAEIDTSSPLLPMTKEERLVADFHGTGLTVGPIRWLPASGTASRPSAFRAGINAGGTGRFVRTAGCALRGRARHREGFRLLEPGGRDWHQRAILTPGIMDLHRMVVTSEKFLARECYRTRTGVIRRGGVARSRGYSDVIDITDAEVAR